MITTGDLNIFRSRYGAATAQNVVQFLTYDEKYPNSILSCLQSARFSIFDRQFTRSIQYCLYSAENVCI